MSSGLWVQLIVAVLSTWLRVADSDGQTYDLGLACSSVHAKNSTEFGHSINATFSSLRTQLSEDSTWFATAHTDSANSSVYALVQCRNYLSQADCLACFDAAVFEIRINCSNSNTTGARLYYDGCFLRYEDYNFYAKTNENDLTCGGPAPPELITGKQSLLNDSVVATPNTRGYFVASSRRLASNTTIYVVAQCITTVTRDGCQGCLSIALEAILKCSGTEGRLTDAACFMRYSISPFFADNRTVDLTPYLPARGKSNNNKAIIGGVAGGSGLVIILVASILWYKFSRQLKAAMIGNLLGATKLQRPNIYSYEDLKEATNNFSEENKLGQGSFGIVYKATLRNGTTVAVKKLDMNYSRAKADFETEVSIISNVHHRNVVRLLGCCSKRSELLLIYEFMENGSLDRFLYGDRRGRLTWKKRCVIISGTAKGIAYLHENYHLTVIHRDIKPSNILLDNDFQTKIADFGLARLLAENQSHVSTKFAGTLGYTAPEYATYGHLSEKVDIYSFGVVVLEIISGRRCSDMNMDSGSQSDVRYLLEQARSLYESGMHQKLADEALVNSDEYNPEEFKKLVEIALVCTHSTPSSRPSMSEILAMLSIDQPINLRDTISASETHASDATVSISQYTGR